MDYLAVKHPSRATTIPIRIAEETICRAFARSFRLNSACSTVSVLPTSVVKLKTPLKPNAAQKWKAACRKPVAPTVAGRNKKKRQGAPTRKMMRRPSKTSVEMRPAQPPRIRRTLSAGPMLQTPGIYSCLHNRNRCTRSPGINTKFTTTLTPSRLFRLPAARKQFLQGHIWRSRAGAAGWVWKRLRAVRTLARLPCGV